MTISDEFIPALPAEGRLGIVGIGSYELESGAVIPDAAIAVQRWGQPSPTGDNVVVVLHALTGNSQVIGPNGWWDGMIGPGAPIDTNYWCAVATNVLGGCGGSTGPGSLTQDAIPWGSQFPRITIRDQVNADMCALAAMGITEFAAVIGGSMGGARALEWIISSPEQVRAALVLATGARATADQIGTQSTQNAAITSDPNWHNGDYYTTGHTPDTGLHLARRFAHLTYRGEYELDSRFGNNAPGEHHSSTGAAYAIESYLEHHGTSLVKRFDAGSYVVLNEALYNHDIGRGRGGITAALSSCPVPVVVGGISSDRLYPLRLQQQLADLLPGCTGLRVIESPHGHDSFLINKDAVGELIKETLELAAASLHR